MIKEIVALAAADFAAAGRRKATQYALYATSVLFVVAGLAFLLNALHTVLALRYDPITASLAMSGGLFFLAICLFVAGRLMRRKRSTSDMLAATALVAAPLAAKLIAPHAAKRMGALGNIVAAALLGRQLGPH